MTRSKLWAVALSLLIFILLVGGGILSLSRVVQSRETLQTALVAQAEELLGAKLNLEDARFVFTPFPRLRATNLKLELPFSKGSPWQAREASFSFSFFPILFGHFHVSGIQIHGGEGEWSGIPFEKIELKVKGIGVGKHASFDGKAKAGGGKGFLKGKGQLVFHPLGENFWKELGLQANFSLSGLTFSEGAEPEILKRLPPTLHAGEWQGEIHLHKEESEGSVEGLGKFQGKNIPSKSGGTLFFSGETKAVWDLDKNTVALKQMSLTTPFAELEGMGIFRGETGEITEARLRGRKVILQELLRNFPALESFLPLDTGLSGESEFDLSLQGTWDYLSLHANWNLTPVVLTYGNIFSKPKDFPMRLNFDFLVKGGAILSGDFSLRIRQATIKGALLNYNLKTGEGEMTLLTNKFDLSEWKGLLPPFSGYRLSGSAKALLNFKGNLSRLKEAEKMVNLTLDNAILLSPSGKGFRRASLRLDLSPLNLRIKEARFGFGNSSLQMQAEIYNLDKNPQGSAEISSPSLNLFSLSENVLALGAVFHQTFERWEALEKTLRHFFTESSSLDNFSVNVKFEPKKLLVKDLEFESLDGKFHLEGEWDLFQANPKFSLELNLERFSLARYFEGLGQADKLLEGNLFFAGKFHGEGAKSEEILKTLSGEGNLSVTNGEWHGLDLTGVLKNLAPLESLPSSKIRSLPFYDLKASWRLKGEKFETQDLVLNTQDFWIEGEGHLSLKGVLNSRLQVYLSNALTERLFKTWKAETGTEGKQLGPIPLLLVGNVTQPESRVDERGAESLLEAIRVRKFHRILHRPFIESSPKP